MSAVDVETGIPPMAPASRPAFRLRGLAVLGAMACSCGQLAFVGLRAVTETPLDGLRQPQALGMAVDGAAPAGTRARSGAQMPSATTAAVLAAGAAAVLVASSLRDGSRTAMASGHDRRTFRGKLHNASFGKYRLRKTKARRLKKIRDGEIDLENVPQHGQPEPEHAWDMDNVLQNRLFYIPQFARDAYEAVHEDYLEVQRAEWKSLMNIKGPQGAFKNWTPPGGAPPPAPKPAPAGGPDDKPKGKDPSPGPAPTEGGEKAAPKAEKKEPEAKKEEPKAKAEEPKAKAEEPAPAKAEKAAEAPKAEAPKAEAPAPAAGGGDQSAAAVKTLRQRSMAGIMDCKKALAECNGDMDAAMAWLKKKGVAKADKKAGNVAVEGNIASYVHFNSKIAVLVEVNSETDFVASNEIFKTFASDIAMQIAANPNVASISANDVPEETKAKAKEIEMGKDDLAGKPEEIKEKIVMGRLKKQFEEMALMNQKWLKDEEKTVEQVLKETISKLGENLVIRRFVRLNLGEGLEKKDDDFAAGVEKELAKYRSEGGAAPEKPKEEPKKEEAPKEEAKKEEAPKVQISAAQVKELRTMSGAGIMDTKKALTECGGDVEKAMEWLKKRGMAKADKKAGNISAEGAIASYVHFNQKIGVIVEVNSETDFVAINAIFKEFAADVAMQIAANPSVVAVSTDGVPAEVIAAEKAVEMEKEDLAGKPEEIKEKIVMGRLKKKYEEMSLLNQKWLKDEEKTVDQVLKEKIAKLGENIIIRRFERLVLGEGLAKKDDDFAAGVEKELAKYRT